MYADWLLEAGDPHGAWIVLQLRGGSSAERVALLAQMNRRLFGSERPPGIQTAWREGFLSTLRIGGEGGAVGARLHKVLGERAARMLHTLIVACVGPSDEVESVVDALCATGPHPTLRHLSLIQGSEPVRLGWHATLEPGPGLAQRLGALWHLAAAVPGLQDLELVSGSVEVAPFSLPRLRALTIRGELTDTLLAQLQLLDAPRLQTLRLLGGAPELDSLLQPLLDLPGLEGLETLVLRRIVRLDAILPVLLRAPLASGLRCLDLSLCRLDPDAEARTCEALAAGALPGLAWLAPWRELSVGAQVTLRELGIQRVAGWREDLRLHELDGGSELDRV